MLVVVTLLLREKYPKTKFLIPVFHRPFYFKAVNSCLNFKYTELYILEYNKSQGRLAAGILFWRLFREEENLKWKRQTTQIRELLKQKKKKNSLLKIRKEKPASPAGEQAAELTSTLKV